MEVAEDFLGPQVDATFSGIAVSQLDHGNPLRPEKQEQRYDPQPDCDPAIGRNRRDHVQIENRHHEQENQVGAAEDTLEMRLLRIRRRQYLLLGVGLCSAGILPAVARASCPRCVAGRPTTGRDGGATKVSEPQLPLLPLAPAAPWPGPGPHLQRRTRCLSMSASVCWTEIVHCSSHQ